MEKLRSGRSRTIGVEVVIHNQRGSIVYACRVLTAKPEWRCGISLIVGDRRHQIDVDGEGIG